MLLAIKKLIHRSKMDKIHKEALLDDVIITMFKGVDAMSITTGVIDARSITTHDMRDEGDS